LRCLGRREIRDEADMAQANLRVVGREDNGDRKKALEAA
jgi:hypothetical protein